MESPARIFPTELPPIPLTFQTSLMPSTQAMANQTLSLMSTLSMPRMTPKIMVTKPDPIAPTAFVSNSDLAVKPSISMPHNHDIVESLINKLFAPNSAQDLEPVTNFLKNQSPEFQRNYGTNGYRGSFLQKLMHGQGYGHQPTTSFLGGSIYFMQQNSPQINHPYHLPPVTSYLPESIFSYEPYILPNSYETFLPIPLFT
ncbi:hypothetical protein BLA29_006280, partial [Euroglyphus maynei]